MDDRSFNYAEKFIHATAQIKDFQDLIRFADTKAGAGITIGATLTTITFVNYGIVFEMLNSGLRSWNVWLASIVIATTIIFLASFFMILYYGFLTLLPRLEKKEHSATIAFFADVYNMQEDSFVDTVTAMQSDELLEHILREIYLLSEILMAKFAAQRRTFQWLRINLIFWAITQLGLLLVQAMV
jgi:hypothetical protein